MSKNMTQRGKLLVLLDILRRETDEEHLLTVPMLLKKLESRGVQMERKSVYESIATLQEYGYDVELQRGKGYYLAEREFQLAELKLLVDAVQASKFITVQKSQQLIEKLSRQASDYQASSLQRQVYVVGKTRSANERVYYSIDAIYEAIASNRQIHFRYFDYDQKKRMVFRRNGAFYQVSPYALIRDNDNYYLVAYDAQTEQLRHYRVDRMDRLEMLDEARQGSEAFERSDPARYADRHFGMFRGEEEQVVLRCKSWLAHVLIDRFGDDVMMIPEGEDTFRAVVKVVVSPQFFGWLFGLEGGAEVLEPDHVRHQMRKELEQNLARYQ